jgi:Transposase
MKKVAAMLKRRFENIITSLTHPITNATSESINAKIQWVKYTARGFRNKQNIINAKSRRSCGISKRSGKVPVLDFSTKRLFPRPFYPQILLQSQKIFGLRGGCC